MAGTDDPKADPRPQDVQTGVESGESIEIVSGLKPGDRVAIVTKRYSPQRGADNPLIMGGRRNREGSRSEGEGARPRRR